MSLQWNSILSCPMACLFENKPMTQVLCLRKCDVHLCWAARRFGYERIQLCFCCRCSVFRISDQELLHQAQGSLSWCWLKSQRWYIASDRGFHRLCCSFTFWHVGELPIQDEIQNRTHGPHVNLFVISWLQRPGRTWDQNLRSHVRSCSSYSC